MEDEDFKIINLFNKELKVFRDGRICTKCGRKDDIKWSLRKTRLNGYGFRICLYNKRKEKCYYIHRIVAYAFLGLDINNSNIYIDHIDHNIQNNNWLNLRIVTNQQIHFNRSNVKGYCYDKSRRKFYAQIGLNGKSIHLGRFEKEEDARNAYLEAKKILHII